MRVKRAVWLGLLLAAAMLGRPIAFLVGYFAALVVPDMTVEAGFNTVRLRLPLFLPLMLAMLAARYGFWRALFHRRLSGVATAEAVARYLDAQRYALLALPVTLAVTVLPMEGNVFGMLFFPLLLVAGLVVEPLCVARSIRNSRGASVTSA